MPDSRPIGLVAWEDATKKKPERGRHYYLVRGRHGGTYMRSGDFIAENPEHFPSYCDPTPPGPDALTVEDLQRVLRLATVTAADAPDAMQAVLRFGAALDALGNGGTE